MMLLTSWIVFDVDLLFGLANGVGLWEFYVVEIGRFLLFVHLIVEYKLLVSGLCVSGPFSLQKLGMLDVVWFG